LKLNIENSLSKGGLVMKKWISILVFVVISAMVFNFSASNKVEFSEG